MKNKSVYLISQAAIIAAVYVLLTLLSSLFGLSNGVIQLRLSECLAVLPAFSFSAVPGLFAGCLIGNVLTGGEIIDVIAGSLATLLAAAVSRKLFRTDRSPETGLRKGRLPVRGFLASLPNILVNSITVPLVLKYAYGINGRLSFFILTVFAGELISSGIFGAVLYSALYQKRKVIFR